MLPKENRLTKKKDFGRVFKQGKGYKESFLFLKIVKNNLNYSRFGFIISSKAVRRATLRNKLKRKLREIFHLKLPEIANGIDGVLVVLPNLKEKDFLRAKEIIDKLFEKANLVN